MMEQDIRFMQLALEQAKLSRAEDNQSHPLVGAVVVKNGEILAKAFRGEIDLGNHAEFNAVEKKLHSDALTGATIYTTLEPCTTRHHPKVPCAERLVERRVSRVVIGMLDPNQTITGRGIRRLREANVATEFFPSFLMAEAEEMNREFIRSQVGKSIIGIVTKGTPELTALMERLCLKAEKNIRFLIHALGVEYKLPEEFAHKLASYIKRREEEGNPIRFNPILVVNKGIPPSNLTEAVAKRAAIYEAYGVTKFTAPRILATEAPLSIDVLIIDNTQAMISITTASDSPQTQISVTLEQHSKLITELADWFDKIVGRQAITLDEFQALLAKRAG